MLWFILRSGKEGASRRPPPLRTGLETFASSGSGPSGDYQILIHPITGDRQLIMTELSDQLSDAESLRQALGTWLFREWPYRQPVFRGTVLFTRFWDLRKSACFRSGVSVPEIFRSEGVSPIRPITDRPLLPPHPFSPRHWPSFQMVESLLETTDGSYSVPCR